MSLLVIFLSSIASGLVIDTSFIIISLTMFFSASIFMFILLGVPIVSLYWLLIKLYAVSFIISGYFILLNIFPSLFNNDTVSPLLFSLKLVWHSLILRSHLSFPDAYTIKYSF